MEIVYGGNYLLIAHIFHSTSFKGGTNVANKSEGDQVINSLWSVKNTERISGYYLRKERFKNLYLITARMYYFILFSLIKYYPSFQYGKIPYFYHRNFILTKLSST